MSNVAIERVRDTEDAPTSVLDQMLAMADKIRQRAFEMFQRRSCAEGHSLDDWLQAERDLIDCPAAELIEKGGEFRLRMAVPGFDAKDLHVTATPASLIVQGEATHTHEEKKEEVYFCEFGRKQLFRRLDMPAPINPDKVTAKLESGILHIVAAKTVDAGNRMKALAAG